MPDALTPLDLDAIEAAIAECRTYNFGMYQADRLAHEHAPALVEEVKRLRAEVALLRPALAQLEEAFEEESDAHDALKAEVARLTARPAPAWDEEVVRGAFIDARLASVLEVMADGYPSVCIRSNEEAADVALAVVRDHLRNMADRADQFKRPDDASTMRSAAHALEAAEAEVERLRAEVARHAPAWDEEAVVEGMARAVYPLLFTDDRQPLRVFGEAHSDAELREGERDVARERMRQALAVVRRHLPVKPDREGVARAIFEAGAAGAAVEFGLDGPVPWSSLDVDDVERMCVQADAVLDLWPGESRATVQAEALREAERAANHDRLAFKSVWGSSPPDLAVLAFANKALDWLRARADRLSAEGGADRG